MQKVCTSSFLIDYFLDSTAASALTDGNLDTSALQNLAFQIVADKLPGQFIDKLFASLGLVTISNVDRGNIQEQSVVAKKPRFSNSNFHGPTLDYSKRTSTSNPTSVCFVYFEIVQLLKLFSLTVYLF